MVQTGCPLGTGTGGESIWGGEFEDEIVPDLKVLETRPFEETFIGESSRIF